MPPVVRYSPLAPRRHGSGRPSQSERVPPTGTDHGEAGRRGLHERLATRSGAAVVGQLDRSPACRTEDGRDAGLARHPDIAGPCPRPTQPAETPRPKRRLPTERRYASKRRKRAMQERAGHKPRPSLTGTKTNHRPLRPSVVRVQVTPAYTRRRQCTVCVRNKERRIAVAARTAAESVILRPTFALPMRGTPAAAAPPPPPPATP